jgi:hypothetical protein
MLAGEVSDDRSTHSARVSAGAAVASAVQSSAAQTPAKRSRNRFMKQ